MRQFTPILCPVIWSFVHVTNHVLLLPLPAIGRQCLLAKKETWHVQLLCQRWRVRVDLDTSWEKASTKTRYLTFVPALIAGMAKLNTYYQRSANLDAHTMAMGKALYLMFPFY